MNQYYMLLKNHFIDFNSLIIEKYQKLDLSETEVIILIKLNNLLNQGKKKLLAEELASSMSISVATISKKLVELVNKGFISLNVIDINSGEEFNLDETYKRLSYLLENDETNIKLLQKDNELQELVKFIESEFGKILKPIDLEVISHWINVDKFSVDKIKEAVYEVVRLKKINVKYVDVILNNKKELKPAPTSNLQELFNNVYKKS